MSRVWKKVGFCTSVFAPQTVFAISKYVILSRYKCNLLQLIGLLAASSHFWFLLLEQRLCSKAVLSWREAPLGAVRAAILNGDPRLRSASAKQPDVPHQVTQQTQRRVPSSQQCRKPCQLSFETMPGADPAQKARSKTPRNCKTTRNPKGQR